MGVYKKERYNTLNHSHDRIAHEGERTEEIERERERERKRKRKKRKERETNQWPNTNLESIKHCVIEALADASAPAQKKALPLCVNT
jgi:hypothetical protein